MQVKIVTFPETRVASITHLGPPETEHDTVRKLVAWKLKNKLLDPDTHKHYGLHYTDPGTVPPDDHRVDFCLSIDATIIDQVEGLVEKIIPQMRCAYARDVGTRQMNRAAAYLYQEWLPSSGEVLSGYPMIFHYVNVGPNVLENEAITDVYMPLE